jgi:hypothetical protein
MPLWRPSAITEEPEVILSRWMVMRVPALEREGTEDHFVGAEYLHGGGRVSSEIKEFDKKTMIGVTRRGRLYKLRGSPGVNIEAMYVWNHWCDINLVDENTAVDVTHEYTKPELDQ